MKKTVKKQVIKSLFIIIKDMTSFEGFFNSLEDAEFHIEEHEVEDSVIMEITGIWTAYFPEPVITFKKEVLEDYV